MQCLSFMTSIIKRNKVYRQRIFFSFLLSLFCIGGYAQDFSKILQSIEQNSTALLAHKAKAEAEKKDTKLTTALDDPEIGFNYLFGNGDLGNRYDLSVSQSFDFPTTIIQRNKFAREQRRVAELGYLSARQQILLSARKLCIEVVYCNAMMEHLNEDLEETRAMAEAYKKLYDKGEATIIDRNKTHQAVLFFEAEYRELMTTRNNLLDQLKYMNNGQDVNIEDTAYIHTPLPKDFDEWLSLNLSRHPSLQLAEGEVSVNKQGVTVARNEWAPKLRVGYMSEFEKTDKYQGVSVGLSVPLWSGNRRIKSAKAHLMASEIERKDIENRLTTQLRSIFNEALQLQETYHEYSHHLTGCDNTQALDKSLQLGQITLITYLQERQYVHEMHEKLLIAERDLELRKAELDF